MEEILLYFSIKYKGNFDDIFNALETHEQVAPDLVQETIKEVNSKYTTLISSDYPSSLKEINCPPFVLFYHGDLSLLDCKESISVVGTRNPNHYGKEITMKLVDELVDKSKVIISEMSKGIGETALNKTIESNGKAVAVLGTGINYPYPKSNVQLYEKIKECGLVISEYPDTLEPMKENFVRKNRIITGISNSLLVTQAKIKDETMITVGHALEQGKDVFCLPAKLDDPQGCNELIKNGAKLVTSARDIEKDLRHEEMEYDYRR